MEWAEIRLNHYMQSTYECERDNRDRDEDPYEALRLAVFNDLRNGYGVVKGGILQFLYRADTMNGGFCVAPVATRQKCALLATDVVQYPQGGVRRGTVGAITIAG